MKIGEYEPLYNIRISETDTFTEDEIDKMSHVVEAAEMMWLYKHAGYAECACLPLYKWSKKLRYPESDCWVLLELQHYGSVPLYVYVRPNKLRGVVGKPETDPCDGICEVNPYYK